VGHRLGSAGGKEKTSPLRGSENLMKKGYKKAYQRKAPGSGETNVGLREGTNWEVRRKSYTGEGGRYLSSQ